MKNYLEKNEKPKKNEDKSKKAASEASKTSNSLGVNRTEGGMVKKEANTDKEKIDKAEKIINYFLDKQNDENVNMPEFKIKSKHKRLLRKCLKLKKNNSNKVLDKSGMRKQNKINYLFIHIEILRNSKIIET